MNTFARWMHGREYIQLLLNWRWLVFFIAIPISLVIEIIEEQGAELDLLDEVLIDGIVLPVTTWIVLTFAARRMAGQFEREASLERRQQFTQRLAENREYYDLSRFLVRFPASLMPVERVTLEVIDREQGALLPATQWSAGPGPLDNLPERYLVLLHDNAQVGVLRLVFPADRPPSAAQQELLSSFVPDIAAALAHAIEDYRQAEVAYQEARAYERRRIAQELHDSLAQQLFYLNLGLDQIADDPALARSEALQQKLASMREVAADVYDQIRHNLSILRAWEQVNLTEAVTELARATAHSADMRVAIDVKGEPGWLSPHTCEQLYGVVREALNNIVKHAGASHVQLGLAWSDDRLTIRLVDDGVGFDRQQHPAEGHYGLALMGEAIEALGGTLRIESQVGGGTSVTASIPLEGTETGLGRSRVRPQRVHAAAGAAS